jgi:hypothetical protein
MMVLCKWLNLERIFDQYRLTQAMTGINLKVFEELCCLALQKPSAKPG